MTAYLFRPIDGDYHSWQRSSDESSSSSDIIKNLFEDAPKQLVISLWSRNKSKVIPDFPTAPKKVNLQLILVCAKMAP